MRGHGIGLFCDSKPHILEDVDTVLEPGMALIVHPNTYHPEVGYLVLGDAVMVTATGVEVLCARRANCSRCRREADCGDAARPLLHLSPRAVHGATDAHVPSPRGVLHAVGERA